MDMYDSDSRLGSLTENSVMHNDVRQLSDDSGVDPIGIEPEDRRIAGKVNPLELLFGHGMTSTPF